jgi:uncharacterized protein (TIGR02147 family)
MVSVSCPAIFKYSDYRQYLRDYYAFMKQTTSFFSHRYFMRKAGIRSPNFLKNVMDGTKNLTKESVLKFAQALGLNRRETDYFENLVFFNQSDTGGRKQYYYDRMKLFSESIVRQLVTADQAAYFAKWYHSVIRELLVVRNFSDDFAKLARTVYPRITPAQARDSVTLLLKLGMVTRDPAGRYQLAARNITAGRDPVAIMEIRRHHKESLENAMNAIDSVPPAQRSVTSVIMSINEETYKEIELEIAEFRNRVSLIANKTGNADRIYQVAVQLYPVSSLLSKE